VSARQHRHRGSSAGREQTTESHPLTDCEYVPPGLRIEIDKNVPSESATLPRWTFARALLVEARKPGNLEMCGLPPGRLTKHSAMSGGSTSNNG
jgi:hypothetical protein